MRKVNIGDVYKAKATGPKGKRGTRLWLVISLTNNRYWRSVHMLGLDRDWNIVSTASYSEHAMLSRPLLFRIKNVAQFALTLKEMPHDAN